MVERAVSPGRVVSACFACQPAKPNPFLERSSLVPAPKLRCCRAPRRCRHGVVRVEEHEDDLYAAVDLVSDKLKRKLVKVGVGAAGQLGAQGRGDSMQQPACITGASFGGLAVYWGRQIRGVGESGRCKRVCCHPTRRAWPPPCAGQGAGGAEGQLAGPRRPQGAALRAALRCPL